MRSALRLAVVAFLLAVGSPARAAAPFRVITWNVFAGNHAIAEIAARIRAQDADLVCLQEVTPRAAQVLRDALSRDYAHVVFGIHPRADGRAIFSRTPVRRVRHRPSGHGRNGWLLAEVELGGRWVQLANLHLEPVALWSAWRLPALPWLLWRQARVQEAELDDVLAELSPDLPTLVVGDMNGDVEGVAARRLRARGLVDSYAEVAAEPEARASIRFALLGIELGERIDFVYRSAELRTLESAIVGGLPSDHDLVSTRLDWAETGSVSPPRAPAGARAGS